MEAVIYRTRLQKPHKFRERNPEFCYSSFNFMKRPKAELSIEMLWNYAEADQIIDSFLEMI